MRTWLLSSVAIAMALAQSSASAQAPVLRAVVSGHVVTGSGDNLGPVRRARVTLAGGALSAPRVTQTDTDGAFAFQVPAASRYALTIQKPGFVKTTVMSAPNGVITLQKGASGQYLAVALPNIGPGQWPDPAFLERLRPIATGFTLEQGEPKALTLVLQNRQ